MDAHDVSNIPRYVSMLKEQKEALEEAKAHEGECPPKASKSDLIMTLLVSGVAHQMHTTDGLRVQMDFLPPPYSPSTTPLSGLRKIMIKQLVLETHHRGTYVLLRAVAPAIQLATIQAVVEDEEEDVVVVQLHHQDRSRRPGLTMADQSILIVKEPYLSRSPDGRCSIRVDHHSDVIFLHHFDEKVPEAWRQPPTEGTQCSHENCDRERCVLTWRLRGQDFFHRNKNQFAIDCYNKAFQLNPDMYQLRSLCFVRALAYLRMNNFKAALEDLEHPLVIFQLDGTSLYYKARALCGLEKYRDCCDIYKNIIQEFPAMVPVNDKLSEAIRRVAEQERGQYKFIEMQVNALRAHPPLLDHATYTSSLCIRATESRGRGLFTTRAVKAGDLLLCEKAFAYAWVDTQAREGEMSLLLNSETDVITLGKQVELLNQVILKVQRDAELLPALTKLHHGSYEPTGVEMVDGAPVVDTFLIERIVALNAFACPTSSRERHHPLHRPAYRTQSGDFSCGLWVISSYMNHSCDANARRAFIGDMMIIRATKDLEPNTEITMWYKPCRAAHSKEDLPSFTHWGFECKCLLCEDIRNTRKDDLDKRKGLGIRARRYFADGLTADPGKIERVVKALQGTYYKPGTEVSQRSFWNPALALSSLYEKRGKFIKAIEWGLKAFDALGFVIEGGAVHRASNAPLVIKKWGLVEDDLVGGWIVMARAYRAVAPELEAAARGYAKMCYRICVGEDESFENTYEFALV